LLRETRGDYAMLTWDPHDPRRDRDPREPVDHPKRDEPWNDPDESPLDEPPIEDPPDAPEEDEPIRRDPDPKEPPRRVVVSFFDRLG
jgi:hypothetical protein